MTKSFEEVVSNYQDPRPEWSVIINGNDYSNQLELLEFTDSVNNPLKFTVKLEGVDSNDDIPEDAEVIVKRSGGELFRGVLKEVEPNMLNTYTFKGTGYSAELEGDIDQRFEDAAFETVVDSIVDQTTTNTDVVKTFSTSYNIGSITVDDFRAKKDQLTEINRLMGEYDVEWYITYDGNGDPVFQVTDQISFTASGGGALDTLTTYGNQSAEMVKQNSNRNKGDFDGVVVRGYGDGDDQVTASAGSTGKGNRVLFYTDKTIISSSQAQRRADELAETKTVSWQEIEVKPSNPNKIYGVGDELEVDSEEARLNDTYRVVESYFKIWPGEDEFESRLNLSNKPQTFVDDFKQQEETTKSQTDYMQGARNVWGEKEMANASPQTPLEIDIYVPEDVEDVTGENRVSSVKLDYTSKPFRRNQGQVTTDAVVNVNDTTEDTVQDNANQNDDSFLDNLGSKTVFTSVPGSGVKVEDTQMTSQLTLDDGGEFVQLHTASTSNTFLGPGESVEASDAVFGPSVFDKQIRITVNSDTINTPIGLSVEIGTLELQKSTILTDRDGNIEVIYPIFADAGVVGTSVSVVFSNENPDGGGNTTLSGEFEVFGEEPHDHFHEPNLTRSTDNNNYKSVEVDQNSDNVADTTSFSANAIVDIGPTIDSRVTETNEDLETVTGELNDNIDTDGSLVANDMKIFVDGTDVTSDVYGSSTSGTGTDEDIDLTDTPLTEKGRHTVTLEPQSITYLKGRLFLDHKKDTTT